MKNNKEMGYSDFIKNKKFIMTADGTAGLYDCAAQDILHSKTGALSEAQQKFINPILKIMPEVPVHLNILDICYGIGYNTKAALMALNGRSVSIDALEYDKNLILLSPFIKDGLDDDGIKIFILAELVKNGYFRGSETELYSFISSKEASFAFSQFTMHFIDSFSASGYKNISCAFESGFLHNIYYSYISCSMKRGMKTFNDRKINLRYFIGDARKTLFNTQNFYDIVFLDAYTPKKAPELWTLDFLSAVKNKMNKNGILISYSKSSPFRGALLQLGFYTGKIISDGIECGTIASMEHSNILNNLSQYDLDIINTRSGIPYRDENLSLSSSEILNLREQICASSDRISRSSFDKNHYTN